MPSPTPKQTEIFIVRALVVFVLQKTVDFWDSIGACPPNGLAQRRERSDRPLEPMLGSIPQVNSLEYWLAWCGQI